VFLHLAHLYLVVAVMAVTIVPIPDGFGLPLFNTFSLPL
jgi:hypothetical protein